MKAIEHVLNRTDHNPTLVPGGFAEAVWGYREGKVERYWLKNNTGFIKVAIKYGLDMVPLISYRVTKMYKTSLKVTL